jgi:hypothetical protein
MAGRILIPPQHHSRLILPGLQAVQHYRNHGMPPPFSVDEVIIRAACALHRKRLVDPKHLEVEKDLEATLAADIQTIVAQEERLRAGLRNVYSPVLGRIADVEVVEMNDAMRRHEVEECSSCHTLCFLSWLQVTGLGATPLDTEKRVLCLAPECRKASRRANSAQ